jgi:hypothetical protein
MAVARAMRLFMGWVLAFEFYASEIAVPVPGI